MLGLILHLALPASPVYLDVCVRMCSEARSWIGLEQVHLATSGATGSVAAVPVLASSCPCCNQSSYYHYFVVAIICAIEFLLILLLMPPRKIGLT